MFSIKLCLDLFGYCCQATSSIPRCWNLGPSSLFLTGGPEQQHFCLHRDGWESATEHPGRSAQAKGQWKIIWKYYYFSKSGFMKFERHKQEGPLFSPLFFFPRNISVFCLVYKLGFRNRNCTVHFLLHFHAFEFLFMDITLK